MGGDDLTTPAPMAGALHTDKRAWGSGAPGVVGFWNLGCWGLGFRVLEFRVLEFRVLRV